MEPRFAIAAMDEVSWELDVITEGLDWLELILDSYTENPTIPCVLADAFFCHMQTEDWHWNECPPSHSMKGDLIGQLYVGHGVMGDRGHGTHIAVGPIEEVRKFAREIEAATEMNIFDGEDSPEEIWNDQAHAIA